MAKIISTMSLVSLTLCLVSCAETSPVTGQSRSTWISTAEQQAVDSGVSSDVAHEALDNFEPNPRVVELDHKQPETTITFDKYRRNTISVVRVQNGADLMNQYAGPLASVEARTGVPPQIIVALWGIESSFGKNLGGFETVNSLATLAFEGRRAEFFRNELIASLHILDQEHMSVHDLRGSWAGAMGQCQFMPTTYLRYAVDGDSDGRRDIWTNPIDTIASIGNYLSAVGWRQGTDWGYEVNAGPGVDAADVGLAKTFSIAELSIKGVTGLNGASLVPTLDPVSLLQPDGPTGETFIVTDNVRALMRWNRSTYFVLSVGLLSDQIKRMATRP